MRVYVALVIAACGLLAVPAARDRFRAQGFFCGRFVRGRWYRVPREAATSLRKLTAGMKPLRVCPPPPSC